MLQAAVLLLEKLTAKQASHVPSVPPSPPKAPVDRQYDSTGVGWGGGGGEACLAPYNKLVVFTGASVCESE